MFVRKPRRSAISGSATNSLRAPGIFDQRGLNRQYREAIRRNLEDENARLDCRALADPWWRDREASDEEPEAIEWTIDNYSEAIRLNPDEAQAYYCRGI